MKITAALMIAVALAVTYPAKAAPRSKKREVPTSLIGVEGECKRLILSSKDYTSACQGKAFGSTYRSGRSEFHFLVQNGGTLSFSGIGSKQVKPDEDHAVQPIDLVLFGYQGKHDRYPAVGACEFENPYKAQSQIRCRAMTDDGVWEAYLLADRPPGPDVMRR